MGKAPAGTDVATLDESQKSLEMGLESFFRLFEIFDLFQRLIQEE